MRTPIIAGIAGIMFVGTVGYYTYRWHKWNEEREWISQKIELLESYLMGIQNTVSRTAEDDQTTRDWLDEQKSWVLFDLADLKKSMKALEDRGWFP